MGASIFWHLVQNKIQSLKATLMMIACQLIVAALSISYKVASNDGMHVSILITYRYLVSSFLILPLALIIERKSIGSDQNNYESKRRSKIEFTFILKLISLIDIRCGVVDLGIKKQKAEVNMENSLPRLSMCHFWGSDVAKSICSKLDSNITNIHCCFYQSCSTCHLHCSCYVRVLFLTTLV
ncbi:eamA domain, WAT1-related protein [Artemisia annua]|uniref:EamA domain, WAT1-related protein n=1 Tax=Artemisia annua TaxID=35608 RepID=A0A2U1Q719_ARTAN|nr:eamA domain, WAT1-related protein [Artemisia annua]